LIVMNIWKDDYEILINQVYFVYVL
jgi:hypothetical protein